MNKLFYAARLRGDNPSAIMSLYEFDSESDRDLWVNDEMLGVDRVVINNKLGKRLLKIHDKRHVEWKSNPRWMNNLSTFAGDWKYS